MKMLKPLFSCALFLFSTLLLPASGQPCDCPEFSNQIGNPHFDLGNTLFHSEYNYGVGCSSASYFVGSEGHDKCNNSSWLNNTWDNTSGNSSGSYIIVDGPETATQIDTPIVWAEVVDINLGETYNLGFAVNPRLSQFVNTNLKLAIFVNDANLSGTINPSVSGGWQEYCFEYTGQYTGPLYYQIRQIGNFDGIGYDYGIDDVYFGNCLETQHCTLAANWGWQQDYQNCEISFTNYSQSNSSSTIVGYAWDFGDGNTSTEANPSHFYDGGGTYNVCLTVYGVNSAGDCCSDTYCSKAINHCTAKPCQANIQTIYYSSYNNNNCTYQFSAGADPNRPVLGYFWDFGDGTTGTGQYPTHSYNYTASYYVCVTIVMQDGEDCCTETFCKKIPVNCGHHGPQGSINPDSNVPNQEDATRDSNGFSKLSLSPNPSKGNVQLQFTSNSIQEYQLSIFDTQGKIIKTFSDQTVKGINQFTIDTQGIPAGTYIVNIKSGNDLHSEKLIIL